jgi:GT2 family glycosyltransferase
MSTEPMVIGICTYNRGKKIRATLDALAKLENPGGRISRIVLVNNASTDDTPNEIDRFIASGPPIPVVRIDEPSPGKIAALRTLFARTDEPLLALTDDDTVPEPGWARSMLEVFDASPKAGVVGGPVINVWESGPTRLATIYRNSLGDYERPGGRHRVDAPDQFVIGASMGVRRAALVASGWLDGCILEARTGSKLECGAEDAEVCIRVRQAGWDVWYEPLAAVGHLIPPSRQTPEYLARLRGAICRGEPKLKWLAAGRPGGDWATRPARRARKLWLKTMLFDWRPTRRKIRLAERAGKREGWEALDQMLRKA